MKIIKYLLFWSIIIHSCKSDDSVNIMDDVVSSGQDRSTENEEDETNNENQDTVNDPILNRSPKAFNLISIVTS
ncbi:hypothetical protein [Maribacter stanieri]|uniref:Uncharacterized protein n=1 Tax=Maribacter stanieri TaxID=440514 RepID=A0A1I6I6I9_9FLAO|nr:hypothetical protein [Maribacter stanieri]SFR62269.1 hypothetical protein SAMN04488010_1191 [Maribacter stanieri]